MYLHWADSEVGQARPSPDLGGGSPADWTTSLAQGQNQPYAWTAGYGIADENQFGMHYWMFDVDMDCEQAFDDGQGHKWFELKAFMVTQLMTAVVQVYERPATEFVAGFVGVSNLVERDGVPVMIRPEKIWFVPDGEPDPEGTRVEAGAIEETAYLGMVTRFLVALDSGDHMSVVRQNLHADQEGGGTDSVGAPRAGRISQRPGISDRVHAGIR